MKYLKFIWLCFSCVFGSYFLFCCIDKLVLDTLLLKTMVYVLLLMLFGLVSVLINRHLNKFNLSLSTKCVKLFISLLISLFYIFYFFNSINNMYQPTRISITAMGNTSQLHDEQKGTEVWISAINLDGQKYDLSKILLNTNWVYRENNLICFHNEPSSLTFELPSAKNIQICFASNPWAGEVLITTSNENKKIDLYNSEEQGSLRSTVNGEIRQLSKYNIIALIGLFFIVCEIIYFLLIYFNKEINYLYLRDKSFVLVMVGILIIRFFYYKTSQIAFLSPDSHGYIEFSFSKLLDLDFSDGRVPIYPLVLRVFRKIFGEIYYLKFVCYFQMALSFIGTFYFYKTLKMITNRKWLVIGITFLFGSSNAYCGFDFNILTESLSLSGVVLFIYMLISYLKYNNNKFGISSIILLLVMTFLRPSFLLFDVIMTFFLLIQYIIKKNKNIIKVLIANIISWSIIMAYSFLFFCNMGIFTISDPMPRQLLTVCIDRGYYVDSKDTEYVQFIKEGIETNPTDVWPTVMKAVSQFGLKRTQDYAKECIKNNRIKYLKDEINVSIVNANYNFISYNIPKEDLNSDLSGLRNVIIGFFDVLKPVHALVIAAYFFVITIKGILFNKKMYWLPCGFSTFIVLIFASSMIATCDEYIRTMIHMYPFIYIGFAYLMEHKIEDNDDYFVDDFNWRIRIK